MTDSLRRQHYQELAEELEATLSKRPAAYWLAKLEEAKVPSGPLNTMAEVYADPQIQARDMVVELRHPTAGPIKSIGVPVKLSETPASIRRPAPLLGQHSEEVLQENGFSAEEVRRLAEAGIIETVG